MWFGGDKSLLLTNMRIRLKTDNSKINRYKLYSINEKKRKLISHGRMNGLYEKVIELDKNCDLFLVVYPKYYSSINWFLLWVLLCFVELIATTFGSFGTNKKMYKQFHLRCKELEYIELCFDERNFSLTSSNTNVTIDEKIKGKKETIIVSLLGVLLFIGIMFAIVFIIHSVRND